MQPSIQQIGDGLYLLLGSVGDRPLQLPLLADEFGAMLIDTGCAWDVDGLIIPSLRELGISPQSFRYIVITHCDMDHQGGNASMKRIAPQAALCCGEADREAVEYPTVIFARRYDAYRARHQHFYSPEIKAEIMAGLGLPQLVDVTFVGSEHIRLGPDRDLEVLHLPGHSRGHLGILDLKNLALLAGDAVHDEVYLDLNGKAALCPTYLHVATYRQTIEKVRSLSIDTYIGCHWPVFAGRDAIHAFCDRSAAFVDRAEQLTLNAIRESGQAGIRLNDLCQQLGPQLGEWPAAVHAELCYALTGHLDDLEQRGEIRCEATNNPVHYTIA